MLNIVVIGPVINHLQVVGATTDKPRVAGFIADHPAVVELAHPKAERFVTK